MIRPALLTDKARVVELLADSRTGAGFDTPEGPTGFAFPFDAAYAERLFLAHLRGPRTLALVHDVEERAEGVLMAAASEHPFGPVWLARETLWWIDPAHRGGTAAPRMLDAYEKWAARQGCAFVGMAGMGDDPAVGALYWRRGYRIAETHYLKAVG
jgi:GNAT superfamily N-acetyltransferase